MHITAISFTLFVATIFPSYFKNKKVLDVGSADINGTNNFLFVECDLTLVDLLPSKNVNLVCRTKDIPLPNGTFDTIISTECFEHDAEYKQSISKIYDLLKPGGLFLFTCASTGRPEHGTRRTIPSHSLSSQVDDFTDYYSNLTNHDIHEILDLRKSFIHYEFYYNEKTYDLYFYGIKNTQEKCSLTPIPPQYVFPGAILLEKYANY